MIRWLALVVLVLAGCCAHPDPCASTDGPQFRCWLEQHPEMDR